MVPAGAWLGGGDWGQGCGALCEFCSRAAPVSSAHPTPGSSSPSSGWVGDLGLPGVLKARSGSLVVIEGFPPGAERPQSDWKNSEECQKSARDAAPKGRDQAPSQAPGARPASVGSPSPGSRQRRHENRGEPRPGAGWLVLPAKQTVDLPAAGQRALCRDCALEGCGR